jgi:Fe-S cluster biogenesis protein NfuA
MIRNKMAKSHLRIRFYMIPFTDEELIVPVETAIEKVRPSLALDGGDIQFLTVKNGVVYVQLQGACVGCGSAGNTLKYGVERQLRMDIHTSHLGAEAR